MTSEEISYVAGLLEGEGCVSIKKRSAKGRSYPQPKIQVNMKDEDVIRHLHRIVGAGTVTGPYRRKDKPHWSPIWHWQVSKYDEILRILTAIKPLMGKRRTAQIDAVLEILSSSEERHVVVKKSME